MPWPRRLSLSPQIIARALPCALAVLVLSLPAVATAQTTGGDVQVHQYQPSPFSDRVLRLDGAAVLPFGQYRLGVDLDYALRPLVLTDAGPAISPGGGGGGDHNLLAHVLTASMLASVGLGHRLEAGAALPLTLFQTGESVPRAGEPSIAGVGNLRLGVKARLFDHNGTSMGAALLASIPGGVGQFTHESGFGGEARIFAGHRRGRLTIGARAGFRMRREQVFYDVTVGNELTAAAGATWQLGGHTTLLAELAGATAAAKPLGDAKQSPLEALLGVRRRYGKTWFTLAAGPGLVNGYGSPLFRVVAGFTWANRPPDSDGDGIPDDNDRCPADPEDRDGFEDGDGCPDRDNDADGILDATDKCPIEPEDRDGFEDVDGCRDPDNDKDGIADAADKCPLQPETVNDFEDDDGCPDEAPPPADKDKDGIADDVDECPEEAEDKDGFEDADGCPEPDNDKDGILDAADKCPLQPETINGVDDSDGCPDKGATKVRLGKNEIETLQPIYFDTDRSRVRHAFHNTLGQVALLLKAHPEIGRCAIEGHTDDTGPPEWNQKLSVLRAASVIEFLSNEGVDPRRLVPVGHAQRLPWASNQTEEGRAKNRRVVFHIEGVNPDELRKQEQRQERRRRIRHRRESEQRQENRQENRPAPKSTAPVPAQPAGPSPTLAPGLQDRPARSLPAGASPRVVPPSGTTSPQPREGAAAPFYGPEPAPAPAPKPAGATWGTTRSPEAPPLPLAAPRNRPPAAQQPAAAPKSPPPEPRAAPPPVPKASGAPPTERAPREPAAPTRPSKRSPRAADGGIPPTLRDLLKLPPR